MIRTWGHCWRKRSGQKLQNSRSVFGPVDAAGAQVSAQQLLAAEHVQRQIAILVVIAVKEASLLLTEQRVVGGVKVQHEFLGRTLETGDELLHQHFVQPSGGGSVGPFLQPAQCGRTGHIPIHAHRRLHGHVATQRSVVVQVLPAQRQSIDPLAQHVAHLVRDQQRTARISDAARCRLDQTELAISRPQQHDAAVTGHAATVKSAFHHTSAKPTKINGCRSLCCGTVWHRHSSLVACA